MLSYISDSWRSYRLFSCKLDISSASWALDVVQIAQFFNFIFESLNSHEKSVKSFFVLFARSWTVLSFGENALTVCDLSLCGNLGLTPLYCQRWDGEHRLFYFRLIRSIAIRAAGVKAGDYISHHLIDDLLLLPELLPHNLPEL